MRLFHNKKQEFNYDSLVLAIYMVASTIIMIKLYLEIRFLKKRVNDPPCYIDKNATKEQIAAAILESRIELEQFVDCEIQYVKKLAYTTFAKLIEAMYVNQPNPEDYNRLMDELKTRFHQT